MPKYIANAYLVDKGAIVQAGQEVELTEEQAEHLGDKVSEMEEEKKAPKNKKSE